jgi:catechol 2,3-dioxygenase
MTSEDPHVDVKPNTSVPSIHPDTRLGPITLRVADSARTIGFYERVVGLTCLREEEDGAVLGSEGGAPLVKLRVVAGARHFPRAAGLYHFALLLPSRAELGRALRRLLDSGIRFGQSDHLVSEALYLSDLDGNGIELYRDRPRSEWTWQDGKVAMAVDPLDLDELLAAAGDHADSGAPSGTRMGHIHLQVSDVQQAVDFYHGILGFDSTSALPGAAFLSAGGYHHHLGLNSWQSHGAPPAPPGSAGLESLTIEVPDAEAAAGIAERLKAAGVPGRYEEGRISVRDPWNIEVRIVSSAAGGQETPFVSKAEA